MSSADTRQRLVITAHELFYRQGFLSVGLDRILHDVGVTKTTFYNHFESKDDLILAVLEHHDQWWQRTFCDMLRERGGRHPRKQIACIFKVLNDVFQGDFNGCIFINVAVEFPIPHMAAHQAARTHKEAMENILFELAEACGAADARAFAEEFSLLMEGTYVTQHVSCKQQTAAIAQRVANLLIDKHLPPLNGRAKPVRRRNSPRGN